MNTFLIILFVIIVVFILILLSYICLSNKISESIFRVDEADVRIDANLKEKYDLIGKAVNLSKDITEVDENLTKEILKLRSRKINNFDFDNVLIKLYNDFYVIYESQDKIKENDELFKIVKKIELIDEELITLRNYYNANVENYNKMIKTFPMNVIVKTKKYKEKASYTSGDSTDNND